MSIIASLSSGGGAATRTLHQTFPHCLTISGIYAAEHERKARESPVSAETYIPMAVVSFMEDLVLALKLPKVNTFHRRMGPKKSKVLERLTKVNVYRLKPNKDV